MKKTAIVISLILVFFMGYIVGNTINTVFAPTSQIPRNISYPQYYSQYSNVNGFDGYTGAQLEKALQGTGLQGLGVWFSYYAYLNNISALYLTAHAIHESGWGNSYIARKKNNLFGFGAYDSSPYWSANYFVSKVACIQYVSGFIAKNYLTEGGAYYEGTTLADMNIHYATDKRWASKIANIMNYLRAIIGAPQKQKAIAENWYLQFFDNKDYNLAQTGFNKYVSLGQYIRDLHSLSNDRHYKTAGKWAIDIGLVQPYSQWWQSKISRAQEIKILDKYYKIYYPYKKLPILQWGTFYEKYNQYYCILLYKVWNDK